MSNQNLPSDELPKLDFSACYSTGWNSFRKWWIPICLLAGVLAIFELGPKQLAKTESTRMEQILEDVKMAAIQGNIDQLEPLLYELNDRALTYAASLGEITLYAAPVAALLSVLLLYISLSAVKDRRKSISPLRILITSLAHIVLAAIKMTLIIFVLPLGLFIYTKLSFVTFLMLDEGHSPAQAVKESWSLTRGNFWPLLGMTTINTALQIIMTPTIIGLIPSTGIVNTARAAAFNQLRPDRPVLIP